MWRHHLIAMLPRLARQRAYAAIMVGALALAVLGSVLTLTSVRHERASDRWLPRHDAIYRVQTIIRPAAIALAIPVGTLARLNPIHALCHE